MKPYSLLKAVTVECIHLDAKPPKGEPYWVAQNRKFVKRLSRYFLPSEYCITCFMVLLNHFVVDFKTNIFSLRERHWAILLGYMEVAMKRSPKDFKVLWTVTFVFLEHQWHIPSWLSNWYEVSYFEFSMLYERLH